MPKNPFKKELPPPAPRVIIPAARLHVLQEMRLGVSQENGQPFYVLKLEMVTDLNGLQAVLASIQSDGAIVAQVLDGTEAKDKHQPE